MTRVEAGVTFSLQNRFKAILKPQIFSGRRHPCRGPHGPLRGPPDSTHFFRRAPRAVDFDTFVTDTKMPILYRSIRHMFDVVRMCPCVSAQCSESDTRL